MTSIIFWNEMSFKVYILYQSLLAPLQYKWANYDALTSWNIQRQLIYTRIISSYMFKILSTPQQYSYLACTMMLLSNA
jgi:hypothetical protein